MNARPYRFLALQLLIAGIIPIAGCFGGGDEEVKPPEPALKEIPTTEVKEISDASEAELFYRAKRYYEGGVYSEAKQALQTIVSNYPLGAYAEFAEIKLADSAFDTQDFAAAAANYEDFYKNHPASEAAPYVLFRAARSNHLAQRGLGRDNASLEKAVKLYDELEGKFPDSSYTAAAREYKVEAHERLAEYEAMVAEFYRDQDKIAAADAREKLFEERWVPVLKKDDAQEEQAPALITAKIQKAAADLPALPTPAPVPVNTDAGQPESAEPIEIPDAGHLFSVAECIGEGIYEFSLVLDKTLDNPEFYAAHREVTGSEGTLTIKIPDVAGRPTAAACPDGTVVGVSVDGVLTVKSGSSGSNPTAQVLSMDNPPRIILLIR